MPKFHARRQAAGRRALRAGAVQEPARRLQRAGHGPAVADERRQPAQRRRVPPHAAVGRIQHLRFRALRPDARQPRAARRGARRRPTSSSRSWSTSGPTAAAASSTIRRRRRWTARFREYVFVHEFGHHFAALADEYYTSDVAYETGAAPKTEPWEPNVTALLDPAIAEMARSRHAGHAAADALAEGGSSRQQSTEIQSARREIRKRNAPEAEMDALFREQQTFDEKLLKSRAVPRAPSARSRAPTTRRAGSTVRRPTASCSRATGWGSARCAGGRIGADHRSVFEVIATRPRAQTTVSR